MLTEFFQIFDHKHPSGPCFKGHIQLFILLDQPGLQAHGIRRPFCLLHELSPQGTLNNILSGGICHISNVMVLQILFQQQSEPCGIFAPAVP